MEEQPLLQFKLPRMVDIPNRRMRSQHLAGPLSMASPRMFLRCQFPVRQRSQAMEVLHRTVAVWAWGDTRLQSLDTRAQECLLPLELLELLESHRAWHRWE
jgi:hypothetical protein